MAKRVKPHYCAVPGCKTIIEVKYDYCFEHKRLAPLPKPTPKEKLSPRSYCDNCGVSFQPIKKSCRYCGHTTELLN